ncbi:MAG: HNH endonuclease [Gammaproteobacteria bacterium]|nr:MAG: HNH endonuclease [Gammaproteobacteria bacterium]
MNITEKYLEALKAIGDWVIISEWAIRFGESYPEILEKAEKEAVNQANETTGLREIAARMSSSISRGAYAGRVEIDDSERPRKVRYLPKEQQAAHLEQDINDDVAPLRRDELIKLAAGAFSAHEQYRVEEFEAISKQLKQFFGLAFEVDHSEALLNPSTPGKHHPSNLQLLLKAHNSKKNNKNWPRFSLDEQIAYIETAIKLQSLVATRFEIEMETEVLGALMARLKGIYLNEQA